MRASPRRSWTSSSSCGTSTGSRSPQRVATGARSCRGRGGRARRSRRGWRPRASPARSPELRCEQPAPPRRSSPSRPSVCTRLTISSPRGISRAGQPLGQEHRLARGLGARARSRSGTSSRVARSSAATPRVRSPKPSITPDSERKKLRQLAEHVDAGDAREDREHERRCRGRTARAVRPPGREEHLQRAAFEEPSSRPGASRKSSALRDGGVSSTITSKSCSSCSSYSFAIALSSCEPATAVESSR